jgi:hypothetical protein
MANSLWDAFTRDGMATAQPPANLAPTYEQVSAAPIKYWNTPFDPIMMAAPSNPVAQAQFDFSDFGVDFIPLASGQWWELFAANKEIAMSVYKRKTGYELNLKRLAPGQSKLLGLG